MNAIGNIESSRARLSRGAAALNTAFGRLCKIQGYTGKLYILKVVSSDPMEVIGLLKVEFDGDREKKAELLKGALKMLHFDDSLLPQQYLKIESFGDRFQLHAYPREE